MLSADLEPLPVPQKWPSTAMGRPPMERLFRLCRENKWNQILEYANQYPLIGNHNMTMDNHITTTIIHQAITSKGDTAVRARVISAILKSTPEAAKTKNGYGSMPLHVIAQRNTKIDSTTKERLINEIIDAYPDALTEAGGVGKRTPLHIIFTGMPDTLFLLTVAHIIFASDYVSARLTKRMIDIGGKACFMKDKHGYLPAHVACRRHTSPDKLRMLLAVNPGALFDRNNDGLDLLGLAKKHATKSHPNFALIEELKRQMENTPNDFANMMQASVPAVSSEDTSEATRERLDSNETYGRRWQGYAHEPYPYDGQRQHSNDQPGPYEPHVVSYQTMHDPQGDPNQCQHPPRLQTFQYDNRDLAPLPFSPPGSATNVRGSQYHYESGYSNQTSNSNCHVADSEHFRYPEHGRRFKDSAPMPPYRAFHDYGSGNLSVAPPSYSRHGHHGEQYNRHDMEFPPNVAPNTEAGNAYPMDGTEAPVAKFRRQVDTFAGNHAYDAFDQESPRFADLSPHSTEFGFDSAQATDSKQSSRKRKATAFTEETPEPICSVQEEAAGASLLLHFSRQSTQAVDGKESDGKSAYRGADLLFEEV